MSEKDVLSMTLEIEEYYYQGVVVFGADQATFVYQYESADSRVGIVRYIYGQSARTSG